MSDLKRELKVVDALKSQFGNKILSIEAVNPRRIHMTVPDPVHLEVFKFAIEKWNAWHLIAISSVDTPEGVFAVIYHFDIVPPHDADTAISINLRVDCPDRANPKISSAYPVLHGSQFFEREAHDLMGIDFVGHPGLERLILPDDFPNGVYPLRKDFLLDIQKEEADKKGD
ncbi:MAG TPA: NADH-quinone oxidoreductase subunit C [Candidatus Bathyarchaeia archaeon]|nr:NADH-quinone oxidoreductase subunit C [Candidatus Bathyarchaeia archaeon]